ncbi:hypothetical protein DESC_150017 [Desulfosarcina cetonica]|nr:hypothetical protein DESC_150017 [Desulfosarcina cetonica]
MPVYRVAATGTYSRYAPVAAPCRRTQIRHDLGELFISGNLIPLCRFLFFETIFSAATLIPATRPAPYPF